MDIDGTCIAQHLRSIVIHSLDTFNLKNAEFAAERLVAMAPDDANSVFLYVLSLYRQGKHKTAFNTSSEVFEHGASHLGCAYVFARLCLHLQKYKEGIYRLINLAHLYNDSAHKAGENGSFSGEHTFAKLPSHNPHPPPLSSGGDWLLLPSLLLLQPQIQTHRQSQTHTLINSPIMPDFHLPFARHNYEFSRSIYPDLSAIYHLLGDLYKAQGDTKNSILNYLQALRYNVYDFEAFQELGRAGADVSVKALYKYSSHLSTPAARTDPPIVSVTQNTPSSSFFPRNFHTDAQNSEKQGSVGMSNQFSTTPRQNNPVLDVYTPHIASAIASTSAPDAPLRRTHGQELQPQIPRLSENKTPTGAHKTFSYVHRRPELAGVADASRGSKRSASSGLLVPANYTRQARTKEEDSADMHLRQLYCVFAKLFKSFSRYDCYKAIRILESLPENEHNTPWVLSKLGRLHYEIVNYEQSKRYFVRLRRQDRTRLEDMEYYSTLLWHLHKKVELTYLANELHDIDANLAITWCVMGNLFSLNREADEAIRCFNKSLSIDPKFTYAYTLRGHEYFSNDNYEKALECFRYSMLLDPRHYNAFYGIGMVYIHLGEYQKADFHFKKAVAINPINIILICCVGMVLEKLGKKTLALRQYELAHKLQPLSALPIFKKAQLLFAMQQFPQALEQFELVKEIAPNEASVHFLLGQLYNIQKDKYLAIREFTIALNLDPKGNYLIREAMESLKY